VFCKQAGDPDEEKTRMRLVEVWQGKGKRRNKIRKKYFGQFYLAEEADSSIE
jgi:hypothetical protein